MSKVLVIATSPRTKGGISTVVKAHRRGLQWEKFHCRWISTHRDGPAWRKCLYYAHALIEYIFLLPFCSLVHIHFSLQGSLDRKWFFFRLAKFLGKKTVVHLHCGDQLPAIWNGRYERIFREADKSLVLSEGIRSYILDRIGREWSDRIDVLYNPCPERVPGCEAEPPAAREPLVLFTGILTQEKGYLDLITAFAGTRGSFPEWKLTLAGVGDVESGRALALRLGVADSVEFPGWVEGNEKQELFGKASIFCLPSYAEGFPASILEAWASGLPTVTSSVGGVPDVVTDGENGLLFEAGDVNALRDKLLLLMGDPALRERMGTASRLMAVADFSEEAINSRLCGIYSSLIGED